MGNIGGFSASFWAFIKFLRFLGRRLIERGVYYRLGSFFFRFLGKGRGVLELEGEGYIQFVVAAVVSGRILFHRVGHVKTTPSSGGLL